MRGLAALAAAVAAWMMAGGALPRLPKGARLRPGEPQVAVGAGVAGGAAGLATLGISGVPAVAVAAGLLAATSPMAVAAVRRARTGAELAESLPDFLVRLRGHLAGGSSLPAAFDAAARATGGRLADGARAVQSSLARGGSFSEGLSEAAGILGDPIADRVLAVIASAHHAGGQRVGAILGTLARSVADELRLRAAHEAALTQQRLTALVALVAPWVLLIVSVSTNPAAAEGFRTGPGTVVVGIGLLATLVGYVLARRAARLRKPPRIFW